MTAARVDLDDVRVMRRRRLVLDGCTAAVGPGITVLIGGNGAGKSTVLAAIAGLLPITSGSVALGGRPVGGGGLTREQGSTLGYLPQDPRLPGRVTVTEAIDYSRWLHEPPPHTDSAGRLEPFGTAELVARLGLRTVADRPLGELSGGMNRLAMIAVAVVHRPAVLLLDEATAGVDVEHRSLLRSLLDDLRSSTAILMSSHLTVDVDRVADRVLVLTRGRFVVDATVADLAALAPATAARSADDDRESAIEAAIRSLTSEVAP